MTDSRSTHLLSLALILPIVASLSGCDNVQWGGTQVEIVPAPPAASEIAAAPDEEGLDELGFPRGPVVFEVQQTPEGSLLTPVAEIAGDSLRSLRRPDSVAPEAFAERFRETVIPSGARFRVFRRGAMVGTFVPTAPGPTDACGVPTATGNLTVVAAATADHEFIAFREGLSPEIGGEFSPPQITNLIRTYASIVAERLILQAGLPRPRSWPGAQRKLDAVEISPGGHPEMSATYLVGDSLAVGPANDLGYSVFYLASYESARGYTPFYSEVRDYRKTGKAAPKLVDYLDWDGISGPEVLVRIFGKSTSWYEMISSRGGRWEKVWEGGKCQ